MATQRSLDVQFWNSPGILPLSMQATIFAAYVKSAPASNFIGLYVLNFEECVRHTKIKSRSALRASIEACSTPQPHDGDPYIRFDWKTNVVWLVKGMEREFPTGQISPLQREGIRKMIERLPRCGVVLEACRRYAYLGEPFQGLAASLAAVLEIPHCNGVANGDTDGDKHGETEGALDGSVSGFRLPASGSSALRLPNSPDGELPRARGADAKDLLNFWFEAYKTIFGQAPEVEGARDMLAAKALISGRTLEQAQNIVAFHFAHPSPFYAERKLFGLHHIRKDCNQIIARMANLGPTMIGPDYLPKSTKRTMAAVDTFRRGGKPDGRK